MGKLSLSRTKRNVSEVSTTHECFAASLMIGQCFAMFPLKGLLKSDFRLLRFRWFSWNIIYTAAYLTGVLFLLSFHTNNVIRASRLRFEHFVTFVFYASTLTATLLFCRLAQYWPQLMQKWTEIDFRMRSYGFCKNLSLHLKVVSAVVLLAALLEHSLYLASAITNITNEKGWDKVKDVHCWKELRSDYNAVAGLCSNVDNAMSGIILLSFANNLFFILVQLFYSLKSRNDNAVSRVYFLYSFAFLLLRTISVSLYAANVNETSKEPTPLLLSVSPEVYNIEIERFLYKIQASPCALTGKGFFSITKSLVLSVAGAIVTYELVLIQFESAA
ncbi:hypothetical protein ILUMI_09439 [Ignelater luminosus]|uniref:Gustatory receptor n=1 Tax=Ignelater luminosus TaxID=2038154 RepID=A0A8K0D483_IGNLU|nr:hypothetical protein ILUMI_09439 [Ignelater luminosus]